MAADRGEQTAVDQAECGRARRHRIVPTISSSAATSAGATTKRASRTRAGLAKPPSGQGKSASTTFVASTAATVATGQNHHGRPLSVAIAGGSTMLEPNGAVWAKRTPRRFLALPAPW